MTRKTAAELQEGDRFTWGEVEWTVDHALTLMVACDSPLYAGGRNLCSECLNFCFPNGIPVTPKPEPVPLPCPYLQCKRLNGVGVVQLNPVNNLSYVECSRCGAKGPPRTFMLDAIEDWNSVAGREKS